MFLRRIVRYYSVELTSIRYPEVKRGNFNKLDENDLDHFKAVLGETRVITEDLEGFNTDWNRSVRGQGPVVLKPKTTKDVSLILSHCNQRKLAVCPQGGNTGLVGGSNPIFDEIIISTALMNRIENLDEDSSVVTAQSGVVLEELDNFLENHELMVPLDLGAKGSCHIGGNASTNAGGLRLLRYGNLHGSILGIEAVLASGEVLDCMTSMKKDNTGYDLKHLFIGSEGTLGIITRLSIQCPPRPKAINVAFLALDTFDKVIKTFKSARRHLSEILSSCEFLDEAAMKTVNKNLGIKSPVGDYPFYMLIETSGSRSIHDEEKLNDFLEVLMSEGVVIDGTVGTSPSKIKSLWSLRERITESLLHDGYVYKYDISLPLNKFYNIVDIMRNRLQDDCCKVVSYGHIGDGNLHLNVTSPIYEDKILKTIEPFIYEWTHAEGGSISAEHGLGFKRRNFMHLAKSPSAVTYMKKFKSLLDPNGILNPYKVLPN